jgi:integrase
MSQKYWTQNVRGKWIYRRRVPTELVPLVGKPIVQVSSKTSVLSEAAPILARIHDETEAWWAALASGQAAAGADEALDRFERTVKLARSMGLSYRTRSERGDDIVDLVQRLEALAARGLVDNEAAVDAALGGVERPPVLLSTMFEHYEKHVGDRLLKKAPDQVRKWRNPRLKALRNFLDVIGDKPIAHVTREDGLAFRSYWLDRLRDEGLDPGTANKDIGHISQMLDTLSDAWRLDLRRPLAGLRVSGEHHNPRIAFSVADVERLLTPGAFGELNPQATAIACLVPLIGIRPSEACNLSAERIRLAHNIPHLVVDSEGREVKTRHARRDLPLIGRALEIMRLHPDGFPRYRGKPDSLSALVNKTLRDRGLCPTPGQTIYSGRHAFKDRLIAVEAPERVQDSLMGHRPREIEYGSGPSLEQKARWVAQLWPI